jgi:DNA-binding MarR family transcriptional regulator
MYSLTLCAMIMSDMRISKQNLETKTAKPKKIGKSGTHPCTSQSPRQRLVELLWSFAPAFQRWSESLMTDKNLSSQRLRILGSIHDRGPRIMSDLKKELGVTATNITALIDSLESDDLVVRRAHPTDRRATVIELSQKAKAELGLGCTAYKDRVADLFSDLSDSECKEFTRTLEKLWNRLQG